MTEKLKVSREVADAIDSFRSEFGDETLLWRHAQGWEDREPLCRLPMVDLATALIVGYEVEMTPHEVIERRFCDCFGCEGLGEDRLYDDGFAAGIEFTLNTLNITVEGVNDNDN